MEEKYIYICTAVPGNYIEFPEEMPASYWGDEIGSTLEDFYEGKWVRLSDEQISFHEENPNAPIEYVWNASFPERTLEDAKREMLENIKMYDESSIVNGFDIVVGGNTITTWIAPDKRANYKNSIDAAELIGLDEVHPVFNGQQLTISTQVAKQALALIQIYADRCFIVTETHKAAVEALDNILDVDNYNYTTGYPEKLTFTL